MDRIDCEFLRGRDATCPANASVQRVSLPFTQITDEPSRCRVRCRDAARRYAPSAEAAARGLARSGRTHAAQHDARVSAMSSHVGQYTPENALAARARARGMGGGGVWTGRG
jgi:hypothetical protein